MDNVIGLDGKPKKPNPTPTCHMRLCLIASDDIDIKNIQTFGIADDGFFMVKSFDNPRLPLFMVNPARIKSIEIFKDGEKPLTKLRKAKSDDDFLLDLLKKKHETQSKNK
tara:strand:- start:297 stop:626 length:330 start_codon:yes stop_codon:yes gene_type:complete